MYIPFALAGSASPPGAAPTDVNSALVHAKEIIGKRALSRLTPALITFLSDNQVDEIRIGGGGMLHGVPADVDIWPTQNSTKFKGVAQKYKPTPDAHFGQFKADGHVIQLCMDQHETLEELIDSFDFAHCQAGAELFRKGKIGEWQIRKVYLTNHFVAAMICQGTYYVAGRWPLRSLARVPKVAAKLGLSADEARGLSMQIVADIVNRGVDVVAKGDDEFVRYLGDCCGFSTDDGLFGQMKLTSKNFSLGVTFDAQGGVVLR
jgi:hypothetical protein